MIEIVAALVISGIFLITLGMMIAYTFNSYNKSIDATGKMSDLLYWGKRLRYELRTATTPPFITSDATAGPGAIDGSGNLRFQTLGNINSIKRFVLHKVSLSNQNIIDEMWYQQPSGQTFDPTKTVYYNMTLRQPDATETMLKGVTQLYFNNINPTTHRNEGVNAFINNPLLIYGSSTTIKYRNEKCVPYIP